MMTEFQPHLTPKEMLSMGVFGGSYFAMASDEDMEGLGDATELAKQNCNPWFRKKANYYQVRAGESYAVWAAKGWIFPEDPLGWFHWYCRWHAGRRHERDGHQMNRWINYKRWARIAQKRKRYDDASPVVKQGLLQWSYDPIRVIHE